MSKLSVPNVGARSRCVSAALIVSAVVLLSACASKPDPVAEVSKLEDLQVEIFAPAPEAEPVPSIDIEEYERQQAEAAAAARALDADAIRVAEDEAARLEAEAAAQAEAEVEAKAKADAARRLALIEASKTPLERALEVENPDEKIKFLSDAGDAPDVLGARTNAYRAKLIADEESGNVSGQAEALVFLADLDAAKSSRDAKIMALKKYAEAQSLDQTNSEAPSKLSALRSGLQPHADQLHQQAVSFFVNQDFLPAINLWETVLLIDPGNAAARNWFEQANEAVGR